MKLTKLTSIAFIFVSGICGVTFAGETEVSCEATAEIASADATDTAEINPSDDESKGLKAGDTRTRDDGDN